jgi:hypothetical protein
VIYFESLARVIQAYVQANQDGAPTTLKCYGGALELVLSCLLLYADDTTILGTSRQWMQGLLDAITAWATARLIKFNGKKSQAVLLSRGPGPFAAYPVAGLRVQGEAIAVAEDGVVLGCPYRAAAPRAPAPLSPFKPDTAKVGYAMLQLRDLFTVNAPRNSRPGVLLINFEVLVQGLKTFVMPKVMYPTPVVDVDYDALDRRIRRELRALLGLPVQFPSVGLYWLLRVWPSRFSADLAKLKMAWRCRHQYWLKDVVHLELSRQDRTPRRLLATGPLGLLSDVMARYGLNWDLLARPEYCPQEADDQAARDSIYRRWGAMCKMKVEEAYLAWILDQRHEAELPEPLRSHFPRHMQGARELYRAGLPYFLRVGGDYGRAGLRLLAGRFGSDHPPGQPCILCGEVDGAHPQHMLVCRGVPAPLRRARAEVLIARCTEFQFTFPPGRVAVATVAQRASWDNMHEWPGCTPRTMRALLWCLGNAIDHYSKQLERIGRKPIRPVQLLAHDML